MDTGTSETQVNVQYGTLLEVTEALRERDARIESLSADLERVTKERDALQQQLRQIRGTDQWRD